MFGRKARQIAGLEQRIARIEQRFTKAAEVRASQPVKVTLDGRAIATAVLKSKEFDEVLNDITHHLVYR